MFSPHTQTLHDTLNDVAGFSTLMSSGVFGELSDDVVAAILEEAGKFAANVVAPLNRDGDQHGCTLDPDTNSVATAPGWQAAYKQWCEAGWASLPCDEALGGQGLPIMVSLAVQELWNTASNAYGIGTLLTQGAVETIEAHGSDRLKQQFLPKMVAGDWTGTMNLTEPQAGSDLSGVRSQAKALDDGSYAVTGTKIYITYGEHDLTENIIHLVLARLPDAPEGTRGISMFLVPKFLVDEAGNPTRRNDVKCIGLEHKLGIHASPTCTMRFGDDGGAVGWLVGDEGRGLNCMFTMMNNARLHVGMQGVAIAERAYQQALAYAHERRQGRNKGDAEPMPIIEHPDVRRMLMDMKAKTQAARSICYLTARAIDMSRLAASEAERADNADLAALLTPVTKAFSTDIGVEVASDGVQVHGGMGYIEETGAAQHLRDARITPIYEGTNGIQALDLVTRKVALRGGETLSKLIGEMRKTASALGSDADGLSQAIEALESASREVGSWLASGDERALASATPYLRLFGLTAGAFGLARAALAARGRNAPQAEASARMLAYFSAMHVPQVAGLAAMVRDGSQAITEVTPDLLAVR
ncbi:acyl-CoA dehydrogenase family protein [Anderseniella sp. Alg231-50]|uniref:acyl-CoA dehydrogenase family protein n=1 Tax=Anderseniella sp. Alg231-50 TaxID=1922226 RepID=UPI000D55E722